MSEFDAYDLAAGLGMSSEGGAHYVGKVLELRYRLRRTWEQVIALRVPVWDHDRACEGVIIGG